jgi:hypothetical protein
VTSLYTSPLLRRNAPLPARRPCLTEALGYLRHRASEPQSSVMICASRTTSNIMSTFDTLPLEILFRILDFISNPHDSSSSSFHPLNSLAAACKHFDSAVEEYTRSLLKQRAGFVPKKKSKTYTSRKKWLAETCQLCYKTSKRRSTLWSSLTCCLACDKKHFPKVVRRGYQVNACSTSTHVS